MTSHYALVSNWTVPRGRDDLWDAIDHLLASPDPMAWWPSVQVTGYVGDTLDLRVAGGFGYSVRCRLSELAVRRPFALSFRATGDLRGSGEVTIMETGPEHCAMSIDWRVVTDRRWMRQSSWLLRPVFVRGHTMAMRQGERHFNDWLVSRDLSRQAPE